MTVQSYAVVVKGVVENTILWDGVSTYTNSTNSSGLISLASNPEVAPGWTYDGTKFSAPT